MQLFYNPQLCPKSKTVTFDKLESGHIGRVLRKKKGDELHITNGKGTLFLVEITTADNNKCTAKILEHSLHHPLPYQLHIAVAPTKKNDRFEWFLEKATEIGITEITPIICAHNERRTVKPKRFERILQSAMKQSLQYHLPKLNAPLLYSEFIDQKNQGQKFIAHCADDKKIYLKNAAKPKAKITILIGPEGDFSPEEIEKATKQGYQPISLGNTRLRTETAAIAACHTIALINL